MLIGVRVNKIGFPTSVKEAMISQGPCQGSYHGVILLVVGVLGVIRKLVKGAVPNLSCHQGSVLRKYSFSAGLGR